MLKLFLIIKIFSFALQNNTKIKIDELFGNTKYYQIFFFGPLRKSVKNFHFRGRPKNIDKIVVNNKLESYPLVYTSNYSYDTNIINKFPKSTLFFINSPLDNNIIYEEYSFIYIDSFFPSNFEYFSHYYIIIDSSINEFFSKYTIYFLVIFSLFNLVFCFIFCCYIRKSFNLLVFNLTVFAYGNLLLNILLIFSCFSIESFIILFGVMYSIYKSYIIISIITFLNGYSILHFEDKIKFRYILILSIIESIITFIFLYIIYFIPSLDNFYLFIIKNIIEHITILVVLIKVFLNHFINLYRQYKLGRIMRAIFMIIYKYKLLIYSKVLIFSLLYCLGFITMNLIQIFYHINYYVNGFYYICYMDVGLELFFSIILMTIFYPTQSSYFYYLPIIINSNNLIFFGEIRKRKEKEMEFSKLNKNIMKKKYLNNEFPLILVEPFAKTDNIFNNNMHIHIGLTKKD